MRATKVFTSMSIPQKYMLGDKLMQGLQRITQKIHAAEADGSVEKLTARQRNKGRAKMVLKKLVHLMKSLQVKRGCGLVSPMLHV